MSDLERMVFGAACGLLTMIIARRRPGFLLFGAGLTLFTVGVAGIMLYR